MKENQSTHPFDKFFFLIVPGAKAMGKFASSAMVMQAKQEPTAVAVMYSRFNCKKAK